MSEHRISRRLVLGSSALLAQGGLLAAAESAEAATWSRPRVRDLRCEYLTHPLGIDETEPRLSWVVEETPRGWMQQGYQLLVASSRALLDAGRGDLWDTGWVESARTAQIPFAGNSLSTRQECWWKVRVRDRKGQHSDWSAPARWEMGLLKEVDWQESAWIGRDPGMAFPVRYGLDGAMWIWCPEVGVDPRMAAPAGTRWFRRIFELPADRTLKAAHFVFTVDDAYVVSVNGRKLAEGGHGEDWRREKRLDVTALLKPGQNVVAMAGTNDRDPAGLVSRMWLEFEQGEPVTFASNATWKASAKLVEGWDQVAFDDRNWKPAQVLARVGEAPWGPITSPEPPALPAPFLRREFTLRGKVRRARLYSCGLGYADLHLNGQPVAPERERETGYTAFHKRALYLTHDVTALLRPGSNALGAVLGTGWYDVHDQAVWNFDRAPWRGRPRLRLLLAIDYTDGRTETVVSDASWKVTTGPILTDGIYTGETYDARKELPGWNAPGYDDHAWQPASVLPSPGGKLTAQKCPPVVISRTLTPVAVTEPKPGVFVVDMGQNFSGHAQLRVKDPAGTRITMRYAEKLGPDGMVERSNIDRLMIHTDPPQPFQTDVYVCKGGEEEESWEQRFSYSGFRYVEVTGFPGRPRVENFRGRFAHTAMESAGEFACSDELLNRIQQATRWSYLSNAQSIPTDCPQREKNGWTGDAQLAAETGLMNYRSAPFYTKWLDDLADNQEPDGRVTVIVPSGGWGSGCAPVWDSAYHLIAWDLYRYCGDLRVLERHYEGMRRYVDYVAGRTVDGIVPFESLGGGIL